MPGKSTIAAAYSKMPIWTRTRNVCLLVLGLMFCLTQVQCRSSGVYQREAAADKVLRIKGSDTMLRLVQRWAESFMLENPDISVYSEGGGSGSGIKALIDGSVEICAASRPWQPDEIRTLVEKKGSLGTSILTARDALSIYLNPDNPVKDLSMAEVRSIFSGDTKNWRTVAGRDEPIVMLNREPNSGTYLFFEEHVLLGGEFRSDVKNVPTTAAIVHEVLANRRAVAYGGMAYGQQLYHCTIDGIEPTADNVRNGKYPISRYLYLYTVRHPQGNIKRFVDWVLGKEGQRIVQEVGYIPLYDTE
jgi:phosphate transport system substrate-binding protein